MLTVVSALLIFGSIAAFAGLYASAGHKQGVLVVTHTIEQGQPIVGSDLAQASAAISGAVDPIPVSEAGELAGRRAAVTIPAGSLLTLGDTTTRRSIAPGDAVVGLELKPGQLPSTGLEAGDQVMVVQTGVPGAPLVASAPSNANPGPGSPGPGVLVPEAGVFDVQAPSPSQSSLSAASSVTGDTTLVSVEVSSSIASVVSGAAAAGEISLVLLPASDAGPGGSGSGGASGNASGAS